jgi:hypothetical protein
MVKKNGMDAPSLNKKYIIFYTIEKIKKQCNLFDCYRLGEIAGLINISPLTHSHRIRKQLQWYGYYNRRGQVPCVGNNKRFPYMSRRGRRTGGIRDQDNAPSSCHNLL